MKVLIFPDFGPNLYPEELKNKCKSLVILNLRYGDIIHEINKLYPVNCNNLTIHEKSKNAYYIRTKENPERIHIKSQFKCGEFIIELYLQEVDTSRPWVIRNYEGKEFIEYLDEYICVDVKSNLYERKNNS